jgi:(p)ppGpp synthase/HD superfamily hydrolase
MMRELLKAARFAKKAHAGQKRAGGTPYFEHPAAVARLLWEKGYRDPDLLRAAYLHDVLEDTDCCGLPHHDLAAMFGWDTMCLVSAVTKRKGEGYEEYYRRVKAAGPLAVALKRADREHNNSDLANAPKHLEKLREKAAMKTALMEKVFSDNA